MAQGLVDFGPANAVSLRSAFETEGFRFGGGFVFEGDFVGLGQRAVGIVGYRNETAQERIAGPRGWMRLQTLHLQPDMVSFELEIQVDAR